MQEEYPMQFRFRCAAVLTAVLLCSAAALPALAEETATPETADSVVSASTYTGWKTVNGKDYWYENGVKQGTTGRGKEIYDPDSDAWYWLDAKQGGAKAVNKDVYQESNGGKWVRYDANGHMIKGWDTNDDGTYYFDLITGAMAKGDIVVDNLPCSFDTTTGIGCNLMWHSVDGKDYWYEAGKRQGYDPNNAAYRGKEIYDPASGAWYWLDNVQQGAKAVSKDVYQESSGGKWVRYDANGQMIKGWNTNENGTYYFDPITGAMAKGDVEIDGVPCSFDETTGIGLNLAWKQENGKDYWYENGQRQGLEGRGKEIYDPESDGWYWLDSDANGAKAVSKDVYQESDGGKWVRYDANGQMIKGWNTNENGTYYFDLITGAMAHGTVEINGKTCHFDEATGILK
jgi:glucan-binding YG repeat protein